MKNNLFLSVVAAFGLATAASALGQTNKEVTFVDVATLGDGVLVVESGGTTKVEATKLTKNQRWTRDRVYVLANNVFVPNNVTLTIEPGTLIRAEQVNRAAAANGTTEAALTPADPGALIVARGGRLIAAGTADAPIIFTSIDDVNVPGGVDTVPTFENKGKTNGLNIQRILKTGVTTVSGTNGVGLYTLRGGTLDTTVAKNYSTDWAASTNTAFRHEGLWGGIVLCGKATVNRGYADGVNANSDAAVIVEPALDPMTGLVVSGSSQKGVQLVEGMAAFSDFSFGGGDIVNPPDDSGVLRFISNRYGGYVIALGAELNSYSFYGVGRGTVLEFLEAWNNQDDDFEFWGGDVGLRYALSMFCGDDGFDTDQGFLGAVQYFVQVQNNANGATDSTTLSGRSTSNYGDSLTENDGPEGVNSAVPFSTYILSNGTLIGRGYASAASWSSGNPFAGPNFRDNGGAQWYNSIIMDNPNGAVLITDRASTGDVSNALMTSSLGRYAFARTNGFGGFDAAGRNAALDADATFPTGPDGKFVGCWFYRNGLANNGAFGVDGKYTNKTSFDADYTNGSITNFHVATSAQLFPSKHDRNGRGASADGNTNRANTPNVIAQLTNTSNRNVFDADPGLTVNPYTRKSGLNLITTNTNVLSVSNSVPNVRNMNPDANFAGAVRNSMWMRGWTLSDKLGVFAGSLEIPVVSLTINGSGQPVISFGSVSGYKYVVEVSTDNRTYSRVTTVQASGASSTVTDTGRLVGATPIYYRVITL
jgi:hypothetical protein